MNHFSHPDINRKTYDWSVRAFSTVKKMLGVNIKLHDHKNQVATGHIFLFNHFSRFETFIPQYLIYQAQKVYCRSVASSEFFRGDDRFTNYLRGVGAVPNNMPDLLTFLAKDILRGNKVIIFPEGGMVKDKKIMSPSGDYSIYSPTSDQRRKHHSGASRLALLLEIYKKSVLTAYEKGNHEQLQDWVDELQLDSVETLLERCQEPTLIVPSNITFNPIRITENFLKNSVERITGPLSKKYAEELLIEGNLVFKDTDMDIRMGNAIEASKYLSWLDRMVLDRVIQNPVSFKEFFYNFNNNHTPSPYQMRMAAKRIFNKAENLRDVAMERMYQLVTLNLSHLASVLIIRLLNEGVDKMPQSTFLRMLYLSARYISHEQQIYLHRSLLDSETYRDLRDGSCKEFQQFLKSGQNAGLLSTDGSEIRFLPKLKIENNFHDIRLENPICVYANECASIKGVNSAITRALRNHSTLSGKQWAQFFFEDETYAFEQAKEKFSHEKFDEINKQQKATQDAHPFFLMPKGPNVKKLGVLLIHGFLASPAEMRGLGEDIRSKGYMVYGTRLEGHGTSPHDLRGKSWQDWMRSLKRGYEVLATQCDHIVTVGFSTGGALSLIFAAERPEKLAGLCAIATPLKFHNPNLIFIPLIHQANRFAKWIAAQEGVLPYIRYESEHPDINYGHIPVRALHELRLLVAEMELTIGRVDAPTLLIQGDEEKVVSPESAALIRHMMVSTKPEVIMIPSRRHGIVTEDIANTRQSIIDFIDRIEGGIND